MNRSENPVAAGRRPPEAALFDLDGTLVATEHRSRAAWTKLFQAHRVPCDETVLATLAGRPGREAIADHAHRFPGRSAEDLFAEALGYLGGPGIPPPEPVRGAEALIKELHAARIRTAVITSAPRTQAIALLDLVGGAGLFDALITAENVSRGKPDPEGYLAGCRALDVPPWLGMAFEDTPVGVAAAKAAGLSCVGVTTTHDTAALSEADVIVSDLAGLPPALFSAQPPMRRISGTEGAERAGGGTDGARGAAR